MQTRGKRAIIEPWTNKWVCQPWAMSCHRCGQRNENFYRGLQKQTAKVNILLALANLILADRPGLTAWFVFALRANSEEFPAIYGLVALRFFFYGIARCCPNFLGALQWLVYFLFAFANLIIRYQKTGAHSLKSDCVLRFWNNTYIKFLHQYHYSP